MDLLELIFFVFLTDKGFYNSYTAEVFHIYDDLNGVVQENLSGIRVVKSFVREEHEKNKFQKVHKPLQKILQS